MLINRQSGYGPGYKAMESGWQYLWAITLPLVFVMNLLSKYTRENLACADARIDHACSDPHTDDASDDCADGEADRAPL